MTKPGAPTGGSAPNLRAYAINNGGDVAGYYTSSTGVSEGFIKLASGAFHTIAVPGAEETVALGVNDNDTVVGAYVDDVASVLTVHGFIWRFGTFALAVDDPNAGSASELTGINNEGDVVGIYNDASLNDYSFIAYPHF